MQAKTIHLVLDNLNIHRRKSLTDLLGAEFGSRSGTVSQSTTLPPMGVGSTRQKLKLECLRDNAWAGGEYRTSRPCAENPAPGIAESMHFCWHLLPLHYGAHVIVTGPRAYDESLPKRRSCPSCSLLI